MGVFDNLIKVDKNENISYFGWLVRPNGKLELATPLADD